MLVFLAHLLVYLTIIVIIVINITIIIVINIIVIIVITIMVIIVITINITTIIVTRPKPAYGRQGLAGSWGQDTDKVSNFWVFLTSHFAQLGNKPTWDHS